MDVKYKIIDNNLNIMLIGELDEYTASFTRNILDELITKNAYNNVIFDLSKLSFMDSTGIGVLIGRYKVLKQKNKNIFVANLSKTIEKIFDMSGMFEIMPKIS